MPAANATIAALKVSLGLDSAEFQTGLRDATATMQREARNQARAADQLASRVKSLRSALDPVYAAQQRVSAQMREAQALYKAGGLAGAEYGRIMGQLAERLRAVSSAVAANGNAQAKAVQSSKALQQAGLNLSRQFTDIFVQLKGGSPPITVLTQQLPQIADAFQLAKTQGLGFSTVVKGLVGSISPVVVGIAGLAAGGLVMAGAFLQGQREGSALANTLQITGVNADLAGKGFEDLSRTVQQATDGSIGEARKVLKDLAGTGQFTGETMRYLAEDIIQLSRFTGQTGEALTSAFAGMGEDVAGFAAKFSQQYHLVTAAQYEHIRLLQEQGRTTEAQLALATSLHEQLGKVGPENLGYLERAWRGLTNAISEAIDGIKSFGRASTTADLQGQLKIVQQQLGAGTYASYDPATRQALLRRQAELTAKIGAAQARADSARVQGEGVAAAERLASKWSDLADNTARARREVQAYRADIERLRKANPGSSLIPTAAQQRQTEAAILKRNTPSASKGRQGQRDQTEEQIATATRAELDARRALTRNVQEITALKVEEIAAELQGQLARVATNKAIDAAQRPAIEQAYRNAAAAKLEAAYRDEIVSVVGDELTAQRQINGYSDRIGAVQDALAGNATQQNAIAAARLARQQQFELEEQAYQDGLLVLYGQISEAEFARRRAALKAAQFGEALLQGEQARVRSVREAAAGEQEALENQRDLLAAQADLLLSGYARNVAGLKILDIEQKIALSKAQEAVDVAKVGSVERQRAEAALAALKQSQEARRQLAQQQTRLVDALADATSAVAGFKDAFRSHDWARLFDELQRTIQAIQASFAQNGLSGGLITAGSAIAGLVGGKGGRAIGGGLGIAGLGAGLGGLLTTSALPAVGALTGVLGVTGAGAIGGIMSAVGAALGPIGLAAGALYAAAKLFHIGGKPSNKGAGFDLRTGAISGDKRTEETDQAVRAAGEAIGGIQDALKAAGIGIKDAVVGLVIGTRDQTQIYLESGRTLRSAVGDSGAAVDTALRALLEGATYVSDAQKKLVESALAAGKGFDAISEILATYEQAQKIGAGLADEIKRLTDPKGFEIDAVKRAIDDQRKAYAKLSAEGYLTADQLAGLNVQLSTLQALQLDEVLKRYAEAVAPVNDNAKDILGEAASAAADNLRAAYDAFASAKQAEIDSLRDAARGLADFTRELTFGAAAGRNPIDQLTLLRREFGRLTGLAPTAPERLAGLQGVGQALVEAARAGAPDALSFRRELAGVRRGAEASRTAAESQADLAQAQLDAATAQLNQLGVLVETTKDMATALKAYLGANRNLTAAGGAPAALNFDAAKYLAANPDLGANWNAGGLLRGLGATLEDAALAHYLRTGQYEIAAGKRARGFADGGQFKVGGPGGIDSQLMQFWASPGEVVSVSHGDPQAGVSEELRGLRQQVQTLTAGLAQLSGFSRRTETFLRKWDGDGLPAERDVAAA